MDTRHKVLVVDDRDAIRDTWRDILDDTDDFTTDGAGSLAAAVAAADRVRYDAALVDIILDVDDETNRDGIKFVKYLRWLDEGTVPVVFTDIKQEPMLVRDVLIVHEAADFISKQFLAEHGGGVLVDSMRKAAGVGRKWQADAAERAPALLSSAVSEEALLRIGFKGGAETLHRAIRSACKHLVPLMSQIRHQPAIEVIDGAIVFHGRFWSKGQGMAIELLAFNSKMPPSALRSRWNIDQRAHLVKRDTAGLSILVLECPEVDRSDFRTPE